MCGLSLVGLIISIVAVLLTLAALLSPGWYKLSETVGLFYSCDAKDGCKLFRPDQFTNKEIIALALMATASLVMLIATYFAVTGFLTSSLRLRKAGFLFILAGVIALIAMVTYTAMISALISVNMYFYSYWLAWVGAALATIGGAINLHVAKLMTLETENNQDSMNLRTV